MTYFFCLANRCIWNSRLNHLCLCELYSPVPPAPVLQQPQCNCTGTLDLHQQVSCLLSWSTFMFGETQVLSDIWLCRNKLGFPWQVRCRGWIGGHGKLVVMVWLVSIPNLLLWSYYFPWLLTGALPWSRESQAVVFPRFLSKIAQNTCCTDSAHLFLYHLLSALWPCFEWLLFSYKAHCFL